MKDRRKFLKNAGSTALFTTLGTSFFIACDEKEENIDPDNNNNVSENGFTLNGNVYSIELNHPNFSVLKSSGGWYLFNEGGMLLVNVGQGVIRAFSNKCPHADCRTSWKYSNNNFTCTCHTSIFNNDGTLVSGPANSDLTSYLTQKEDDILKVTT